MNKCVKGCGDLRVLKYEKLWSPVRQRKVFEDGNTHTHTPYLPALYSELTNLGSEVTNIASEVTDLASEVMNIDFEVTNTASEVVVKNHSFQFGLVLLWL